MCSNKNKIIKEKAVNNTINILIHEVNELFLVVGTWTFNNDDDN